MLKMQESWGYMAVRGLGRIQHSGVLVSKVKEPAQHSQDLGRVESQW